MNETEILDLLKLNEEVYKLIDGYLNIRFSNLKCRTPYWRNKNFVDKSKNIKGFLGGKGLPVEIEEEIFRKIDKLSDDQMPNSNKELFAWLKKSKIGVDCSGLAFAILRSIASTRGDHEWESRIVATSGGNLNNEKRFRTNANTLTSDVNSRKLLASERLRLGDLFRLMSGKHVMIILGELKNKTYYIHSSGETVIEGVHMGYFYKIDEDNLEFDKEDILKNESTWNDVINEENEDGVYRMKGW